jgi:hypothetical protein
MIRFVILAALGIGLSACVVAYPSGPYAYSGYHAAAPYGPHPGGPGGWVPMAN